MPVTVRVEHPPSVQPGETFRATAIVTSDEARACPRVSLALRGTMTVGSKDIEIVDTRGNHAPGSLSRGEQRFEVEFAVPADAPPTYAGNHVVIAFEITAEVELPWAVDPSVMSTLEVVLPEASPPPAKERRYRAESPSGRIDGEPKPRLEVRVAPDVVVGRILRGTFRLDGTGSTVRAFRAVVRGTTTGPSLEAEQESEESDLLTTTSTLPFELGVEHPFELRVPERTKRGVGHVPSFSTPSLSLKHDVRFVAVREFYDDLAMHVPLLVRPFTTAMQEARETRRRAAEVDRQHAAFEAARATLEAARDSTDAAKHTVSIDEAGTRLDVVRGSATTHITSTVDETRGPILRAVFRWDALGVGFRLDERSSATFEGMPGRTAVGDRFRVSVRSDTQADVLLTPELETTLAMFQTVALHDRGGTVTLPGSVQSRQGFLQFVSRALSLHRFIRMKRKRVPLHSELTAYRDAYAAFATRRRATLAPGDLSVDADTSPVGWSLRFRFSKGALVGSEIVMTLGENVDLPPSAPAEVSERIGRTAERVGRTLRVPLPLCADPTSVESLVDALVDVTRALARGGVRGPYR